MSAEYTPTTDQGWALVDFMARIIEDAQDAPHFTTGEHALMAAGELERGWLVEHDRAVKDETAASIAIALRSRGPDYQAVWDEAARIATAHIKKGGQR